MIAKITSPSFSADALERVDQIDASTTVEARLAPAIVDVLVTVNARVSGVADASSVSAPPASTTRQILAAAT